MSIIKRGFYFMTVVLLCCLTPFPSNLMETNIQTVDAASAKLNETTKKLLVSEKFTLKPKGLKARSFSSSNPSIVSVSKKGAVTAKKAGTASILVTPLKGKPYKCRVTVHDTVDLIIFAGQSNMTNVGTASLAPTVKDGYAYEALLKKNKLSPLKEPFGVGQVGKVTKNSGGSLASAFANSYYSNSGKVPMIAVNTAVGNTNIFQWNTTYYKNIISSANKSEKLLKKKGLRIRHRYVVFFQGENDGSYNTTTFAYQNQLITMLDKIRAKSNIEKCLLIRIGTNLNDAAYYNRIAAAQTLLCRDNYDFILISTIAGGFKSSHYQEDGVHMTQKSLNLIGKQAGEMAGKYAKTEKEPSMKDPLYRNTYHSNCN